MKRTIAIFLTLFGASAFMVGQSAEEEVMRLKQQYGSVLLEEALEKEGVLQEGPSQEAKKPGHWNFSVGTSYSYMKGYGSGMMLYTAPTYTLSLNNRWSVHGGVIASHYQGMNYQGMNNIIAGENILPNSFSGLALFAAASYRASDRLILHSTGVKQLISAPVTPFTPYPLDKMSFGATFKLSNNFTIGASVRMNKGRGYLHSPMYSNPFTAPFSSPIGW